MSKKSKYVVDVVFHGEFESLKDAYDAYFDHVFVDAEKKWSVEKRLIAADGVGPVDQMEKDVDHAE